MDIASLDIFVPGLQGRLSAADAAGRTRLPQEENETLTLEGLCKP